MYFVLLRLWVDWLGNSVAVMRSLSVVFSLLAFPCIYWLCLELFQQPLVGWMSVALIAVSPFDILYAQEARMYSLQMLMILVSSAVLLRAIRIKSKLSWGLYALSLSLSIYTHTLSLFVAVAHGIYVVANYGIRRSTEAISLSSMIRHWAINLSRIFLDFNPSYSLNDFSSFNNFLSISSITLLLILVGYSIYFLCRNAPRKTWIFILTLIIIPLLVLVLPDLLFGGIRSQNNRYLVASYLGIHLAVAYLLATKMILSARIWQQKFWQIITLVVIGCGITSCTIIFPAEIWWNKYYSKESFPVAKIVNQANNPLLLIENYWWSEGNLYSISQFLDPKVQIQLLPEEKMVNKIPDSFSNVFLLNPSATLQEELENSQSHKIQVVDNIKRFSLWKLEK
ncbi:MAG: glycosyltransferase family 39 protein [Xenococcus sp. MO_188.B8]|nr:glycosyltransferase family 39 protein [Xenococcus sp. MO_188.B8]